MKLKRIELVNFRNYEKLELLFKKNIVCFTGLNGQGKTNIVEAVAVLGLLSSFRTQAYADLIKFDSGHFFLKGDFLNSNNRDLEVSISYDGNAKKIMFQNKRILKFSEMWGKIPVVYLIPEESSVTGGAPAFRREFLDKLLSMTDPEYFSILNTYNAVLKQKNKLLFSAKFDGGADMSMAGIYNSKIAELGTKIFLKRTAFLEHFLTYFKDILRFISDGLYNGDIGYETAMEKEKYHQSLTDCLKAGYGSELTRGISLIGPHKDDLEFMINGKSLRKFGSKGQHKLFLVALKLAEIEYIKSITEEYPIFILDDLYSEIDENKSLMVAKILDKDIQTFITTSNSRIVDQLDKEASELYRVENGVCRAV
jgi:DNA replication and repair protein RecF